MVKVDVPDSNPKKDILSDEILELSLSSHRTERDKAENELRAIANNPRASKSEKYTAKLNLVILAQHRGDHKDAIRQLDLLGRPGAEPKLDELHLRAVSLTQIGKHEEAAALYDKLLATPEGIQGSESGWWELEAGRTYSFANRHEDAIRVTQNAASYFESKGDHEHSLRAKSNLAIFMLKSNNEDQVREAENLLDRSWYAKLANGDPEGASTNLCQLGIHYMQSKRFERAIAYFRKDLKLSRMVGNDRLTASTLCNLAAIYLEALQLSDARNSLGEAKEIGRVLDNPDILSTCAALDHAIECRGKDAGKNKIPIGKLASCPCESGRKYVDCCGRADHEPDLNMTFSGPTEDVGEVREFLRESGLDAMHLDFALRESQNARHRVSWTRTEGHDGWYEILEMPDMANMHLNAAEALAHRAATNADAVDEPIACAMLSVSALEAFINSTIYFAVDAATKRQIVLPTELRTDAAEYQRRTELTLKWTQLGEALCEDWPPPTPIWTNFTKLVQIRNELVHYKADGFTRVFPAEQHPHPFLRNLPVEVKLRDVARSWPVRLLTPSFACWTVAVANSLIDHFRSKYRFGLTALKSQIPTENDKVSEI